jgi:hypothetical protein
MKTCFVCQVPKDLSEFAKNASRSDGLQSACKDCKREIDRNYYKATFESRKSKRLAARQASLERGREVVWDHLATHPCIDCGETDPVVLEFDHVHGEKANNVTTLVNNGVSVDTILIEIKKCVIRCANCHRRRTAERAGGWRHSRLV